MIPWSSGKSRLGFLSNDFKGVLGGEPWSMFGGADLFLLSPDGLRSSVLVASSSSTEISSNSPVVGIGVTFPELLSSCVGSSIPHENSSLPSLQPSVSSSSSDYIHFKKIGVKYFSVTLKIECIYFKIDYKICFFTTKYNSSNYLMLHILGIGGKHRLVPLFMFNLKQTSNSS